jgi:pimeloyl-ACP methyl ester carboxylesterase
VVFITGSGPQNRDEEVFDHRPFLVLADFLARRGVASLRVDDRGVGKSTGRRDDMLLRDIASDTAACIEYLRARFEFGPIGLIGHSEGASVASMVAAKRDDIAFLILLAGPAVDGKALMVEQNRLIFKAKGFSDQRAAEVADRATALFDAIISSAPETELRDKTRSLINVQTAGNIPAQMLDAELDKQMIALRHPSMKDMLMHDPRKDLAKLAMPLLALWGEKDVQVGAELNHREAGLVLNPQVNKKATLKIVPGVNHLFQTCETGDLAEYAIIEETFSPKALSILEEWIGKQGLSAAR